MRGCRCGCECVRVWYNTCLEGGYTQRDMHTDAQAHRTRALQAATHRGTSTQAHRHTDSQAHRKLALKAATQRGTSTQAHRHMEHLPWKRLHTEGQAAPKINCRTIAGSAQEYTWKLSNTDAHTHWQVGRRESFDQINGHSHVMHMYVCRYKTGVNKHTHTHQQHG